MGKQIHRNVENPLGAGIFGEITTWDTEQGLHAQHWGLELDCASKPGSLEARNCPRIRHFTFLCSFRQVGIDFKGLG